MEEQLLGSPIDYSRRSEQHIVIAAKSDVLLVGTGGKPGADYTTVTTDERVQRLCWSW